MRYLKNKFLNAELNGKVFYILVLSGFLFSVINTIINIILNLSIITVFSAMGTALLCLILIIYAFKTNEYKKASKFGFIILIALIYPSLWIHNNGIKGSIPYFIIFNTILLTIICNKKTAHQLYVLQILVLFILGYIEIYHRSWIIGYSSNLANILDMLFSFVLMGSFSVLIIKKLMIEYHLRIDELNELQAKFKHLSITDELTGIFNRRHIIQEIDNKLKDDVNPPFALIMIDIDDFKVINDRFGHGIGDEVIVGVSKALEHCVRPIDVVGRIGGEEFLIILMDTTEEEARSRALSMKNKISELKWSVDNLQVTVSGGVCGKMPEDELNDLLERVDRYLYKAKRSGKNTIM
ncbi:MAG: GGDEF domain-containing protein [Clostridia bacterium]|nr:GGDEF domain-containing protein [Clostridia bacterium]